jgi:repressor LexA
MPLDPKTARVLAFIQSFEVREGLSPTRQEIKEGLALPNLMAAQRAVQKLKKLGHLRFETQSKRGIELTHGATKTARHSNEILLPLLGEVAAGKPIEAIENYETLPVPRIFVKGSAPHFVLKVSGDSMIEDHICDGDFVIIRSTETAHNGEKVVALIDGHATLKRFYRKQGRVELHPANEKMKPILVEAHQHLRIAGIFTGLIRIPKS